MAKCDYRDLLAGGALAAVGLFVVIYTAEHYDLGTFGGMGPGMFPTLVGGLLTLLGAVVFVPALFRPGELPSPDVRAAGAILSGVLLFGLTINHFGLVPAIAVMTAMAALANKRLRLRNTAMLVVALSVMAVLVFWIGLKIQVAPFMWRL